MDEIRQKKRRRRIILFSILGGVVVLAVALIVACSLRGQEEDSKEGEYKQVERRTIANSVSGNGVVTSRSSEDITTQRFGSEVKEVYVSEGDNVVAGQVICQFETESLLSQLRDVRNNISKIQEENVVRDAEYDNRVIDTINNRENAIRETEQSLNVAVAEYIQTATDLDRATQNYNDYIADPNHHEYDTEASQMRILIENLKNSADAKKAAASSLDNTLKFLKADDGSDVFAPKNAYDEGVNNTIRGMEELAQSIEKAIADSTVRASATGTITKLNVKPGQRFVSGSVATIDGPNNLEIEAEVSEYDIADVAVGMKAMIKTDSTRNEELSGVVTYVANKASNSGSSEGLGAISSMLGMDVSSVTSSLGGSSSSASYVIRIALDEPNSRLRLGMNAKVSIITESVENVLSVPQESIIEESNGDKYIEVATNYDEALKSNGKVPYENKKVKVTTGIKGSYYVQINGDVNVGDYVYVPAAEGADSIDEIMNMVGAGAGV